MIKVTCGIIIVDSKILAVQHGPNSSLPMKWEFPGGKMKRDETAEQCIIRELQEELLIYIEPKSKLNSVEFEYPGRQIELIPFVCSIISGELTLTEHIAEKWFYLDEWQSFDWAEADRKLIMENYEQLTQITRCFYRTK